MLAKLFFLNLSQMNENPMKMIIPPTVGFLAAGVATGICYLLIESLRKRKCTKSVSKDDLRCACCLKPFFIGKGVECNDCGARSCRKGCCRWDSIENSWLCLFCYHNRSWTRRGEKWFRNFGGLPVEPDSGNNFSTARSRVYDEGVEHVAVHTELDLAAGGRKEGDPMETVREFVEKIVEGLVGNVDDTPIDRLYDHRAYDQLFQTYGDILARTLVRLAISLRRCIDNKPATDTPTMAHTALRELVERAVDEARKLPSLGPTVSTTLQEDSSFSEHNYEDLLATAILNKVIEKFQNERVDDNSNVVDKRTRSKHANHDNEMGLDEGVEEGSSSLEPLSQDECSSEGSGSRTRRTRLRKEPLSLTIEEKIEEVTTYGSDEEIQSTKMSALDFRNARRVPFPEFGIDIVDPSQDSSDESQEESNDFAHAELITPVESWEENWLFQKRKIQTQSEPVSMLVPNPSADYRALIGDRDAEDTSDLSEFSAQSDTESDDENDDEENNEESLYEAINESMKKSSRKIDEKSVFEREEIFHKNEISEKSWKNHSRDRTNVTRAEKIIENQSETMRFSQGRNSDDKCEKNVVKRFSSMDEREIDDCSKLSKNSREPAKKNSMKNPNVPKTRVSHWEKNSSLNDETEIRSGRHSPSSNERVNFVDKIIEDNWREGNNAGNANREVENGKNLSSCDVNENFTASTINGCLEDVSQERTKTNGSDERCKKTMKKVENLFNEETALKDEKEKNANDELISEDKIIETANSRGESLMKIPNSGANREIELSTPPRPGTIAEREHKKWENAAPIENNPYSEENIQKRLLERQYARRSSSDVSGGSTKFPTSPSPPLQIIMGAGRPDHKRFGRDYYINEAKFPNGRGGIVDTGFYAATSRPESSMSQSSLSTGSEYEHQERARSIEEESIRGNSSDSRRKTRRGSMPTDRECRRINISKATMIDDDRGQSLSDVSGDSYEKNHESERKNTKNAINARLNNRGNFDDDKKPIKRIDLRSYGFDNEINANNDVNDFTKRQNRVVNRLDLRSFGYESGLRRTQSNNNIDVGTNSSSILRSRTNERNLEIRSNLYEKRDEKSSTSAKDEISNGTSSDNSADFSMIKTAISAPNIDQLSSRFEEKNGKSRKDIVGNIGLENFTGGEKRETNGENDDERDGNNDENYGVEEISLLPSVKRLARAFDKTEEIQPINARRMQKTVVNSTKERPTTPEIRIIDTPRQMHSLTARSISREFREGLRQIASKQATIKTKIIAEEKERSSKFSPKTTSRKNNNEETILSGQGKLKSNIKFWEEMREKS